MYNPNKDISESSASMTSSSKQSHHLSPVILSPTESKRQLYRKSIIICRSMEVLPPEVKKEVFVKKLIKGDTKKQIMLKVVKDSRDNNVNSQAIDLYNS